MRALLIAALAACGSSHGGHAVDSGSGSGSDAGGGSDAGPGSGSDAGSGADGGMCAATCPSGQWCTETAPIASTVKLVSAWAADASHVFAVGDAGTIVLRDCSAWTALSSGTTMNLTGVWAASGSDAWAVGDAGTLLHWDGSTWTATAGQTADFTAVWGTTSSDVWAVTAGGQALHYDGTSWTPSNLGGVLLSVSGTGANDVWAAGESAYVRHYTGTWGPTIDPAGDPTYFAVLARSPTNVWVTSAIPGKETMSFNGSTWTAHTTNSAIIQGLWARADADIWGVASKKIEHWNGTAWSTAQQEAVPMFGVTGTSTDVYVVGQAATILHRD